MVPALTDHTGRMKKRSAFDIPGRSILTTDIRILSIILPELAE
jgi:hypothetical protein